MDKNMIYKITMKDLEECFNFSVKYHLKQGGSYNRTTGQYRGLGGVVDSFLVGKMIEIGVASIIGRFTKNKILLDFDIHKVTDEPDIVGVEENESKREPKIYVEIKNVSPEDRWTGLTIEQFNTILKNKIVNHVPSKAFIVYASLMSKSIEDEDLLGVYLKAKTEEELFEKFCEIKDLQVKMQCILTAEELKQKGIEFKEGSYMYETNIFQPASILTSKRVLNPKNKNVFKPISITNNELPIIMMRPDMPTPKEFGKFRFEGDLKVFVKKNLKNGKLKSQRMYIHCENDSIVKNDILGNFNLKKDVVYDCFFTTLGRNPVLKRDNFWIATRNLNNVITTSVESRIKEIGEKI